MTDVKLLLATVIAFVCFMALWCTAKIDAVRESNQLQPLWFAAFVVLAWVSPFVLGSLSRPQK